MIVEILRFESGPQGTFGVLAAPGFGCYTLELPWRENQVNVSCIPAGEYRAVWNFSPTFQRELYLLEEVPGRTGIRIHPGNRAGDESQGFVSDSLGCILLGAEIGALGGQRAILKSRRAMNDFVSATGKQPLRIRIREV